MSESIPRGLICPHCEALNLADATVCERCSRDIVLRLEPERFEPMRFSIGSIMLLVAVVAVVLGLFRVNPYLGIDGLIVAVPAMIRTMSAVRARNQSLNKAGAEVYLGVFVISVGVVLLALFVGVLAFGGSCFVLSPLVMSVPDIFPLYFLICAVLGIAAFVFILVKMWRERR